MKLRFQCPHCQTQIVLGDASKGAICVCQGCAQRFNLNEDNLVHEVKEEKAHEVSSTGAQREKMYPRGTEFPARYDLMFRNAAGMRRLAETWGEDNTKYGPDNWMNGFPASVMISHALEHIRLYMAGDRSEDHLAHGAWNLLGLCWVEENKPELMDLTFPTQVCFQDKSS